MKIIGEKWVRCDPFEPSEEPFWTLDVLAGISIRVYLVKDEPWFEVSTDSGNYGTTRIMSRGQAMFLEAELLAADFFENLGESLRTCHCEADAATPLRGFQG